MKKLNPSIISPFVALVTALSFASTGYSLSHQELMWALKNRGGQMAVDLNPLQSYRIQGVAGQDLNLLPAVNGRKVKVAVVDTGVDLTHPDLKEFIFKNESKCEAYANFLQCLKKDNSETEDKKIQLPNKRNTKAPVKKSTEGEAKSQVLQCRDKFLISDENIYPADCYGWSILDQGLSLNGRAQPTPNNIIGRPDFDDPAGHGTHVAGTIISVSKNIQIIPVQVIGIGPNQPIKPYSVDLAASETIRGGFQSRTNLSERVARGIIYAMNSGAEVINLSLGWPDDQNTDVIRDAIAEAQKRGIIIVAAAGNDSTSALLRPCQYKNVICVAASRPDGALASFSNFGFGVDIAAPGVEILSTIPLAQTSVRFPGFLGYDYLSGTSQATPYVSGVVAEMLSRGIPPAEIYPRLILGARPIQKELPVIKGPVNSAGVKVETQTTYKKIILSGLIDMQRSMEVSAQPLILPSDKDTQIIEWNRQSANLSFSFKVRNYWKNIEGQAVSIQVRSTLMSELEPAIVKAEILGNQSKGWATNEERAVKIDLQIRDNKNPSLSRVPRELSYQIYVMIDGKVHRQFEVKAEVIAIFDKEIQDPDVTSIPITGVIPQGMTLTPVEEIYDNGQLVKDYFLFGKNSQDSTTFDLALFKMTPSGYTIEPTQTLKFDGDLSLWRPKYKVRMDIDGDGQSEYIFGIIEYVDKELGVDGPWRNHFYIFDGDMHLKQTFIFDDKRIALPYNFFWMKVGNSMRPAWVAKGPEIKKQWDVTDLWALDKFENVRTPSDIRLYFLGEDFKLNHAAANPNSRIVDVIQPTLTQIKAGILPVLIARNSGTDLKPSYINEFSIGEMRNGQLVTERRLSLFNSEMSYRNLVDTFTDRTFSVSTSATEFKGAMWYGKDSHDRQRVTLLDLDQLKIFDQLVTSQRNIFDAALQIRAGFQSEDRRGVFLMTNSEIEYHDLVGSQVATRSLNRYSFYGENVFIELHNPITIIDRTAPNKKLPGLFTTEGSGVNKGIKMMVPVYTSTGLLQKIISPARLSFKAAKGCRSLGTPLFMGEGSGYAIDYYCGDQMKRLLLKY